MPASDGRDRPPGRRTPGRMAGGASYVLIAILAVFTLVGIGIGGPRACSAPDDPRTGSTATEQASDPAAQ